MRRDHKPVNPAMAQFRENVVFKQAVHAAIQATLDIVGAELKDKYAWSEKKVQQFEADVLQQFDSVARGYATLEDYQTDRRKES